jgi:hypothetical protein
LLSWVKDHQIRWRRAGEPALRGHEVWLNVDLSSQRLEYLGEGPG